MKNLAPTKISVLIYMAMCSLSTQAAEKYWMGSGCGTDWSSACWSAAQGGPSDGAGQPQAGDNVFFYMAETTNAIVDYQNTAQPAVLLNSLNIDSSGQIGWNSGTGIPVYSYYQLNQNANTALASKNESIAATGFGVHQQNGGINTIVEALTIGRQATGYGAYNLTAGALSAQNQIIGDAGRGDFTQGGYYGYGSSNTVSDTLTVGRQAGSYGSGYYSSTYSLNEGALTAGREVIGDAGNGSFYQNGGVNTVGDTLTVGRKGGSHGYYGLFSGTLTAVDEVIGDEGGSQNSFGYGASGSFNQYGGTNTVSGTLTLGKQAGSFGSYGLFSGVLAAGSEVVGDAGNGYFDQNGGTNTVAGSLTVGKQIGSLSFYNLVDGALTAANEVIGDAGEGIFSQGRNNFGYGSTNPTNSVTNTLTLGKQVGGHGVYNLISGALSAIQEVIGDAGNGAFNQSGGTNTVGDTLTIGKQAGSQGSYDLSAGALVAANEIIGDAGSGTFTQGAGNFGYSATNKVSDTLTIGKQAGSFGVYNLIAGTLSAARTIVGDAGIGIFNQSGGTHSVSDTLTVGKQAGGQGTYNLSAGELAAVNEVIGDAGVGTFTQGAGNFGYSATNKINDTLTIGKQAGSYGVYNLFAGALSAARTIVGDAGIGIFVQSGGTHSVSDTLTVGKQVGGQGTYNLSGGELAAVNEVIGDAGDGTFNHFGYGATNSVSNTLTVGQQAGSHGVYNLFAGALSTANTVIGDAGLGIFNQIGGTHTVADTLTLGKQAGGQGSYNLIGGTLTAANEVVGDAGTGVFQHSSGINNVSGALMVGRQAGGKGTYNLASGQLNAANVVIGGAGTGSFKQTGGTHTAGSLTLGAQTGSHGSYQLAAGTLNVTSEIIGDAGIGVFNQSGGAHTVDLLTFGKQHGGAGTYNLTGGSLSVGNITRGAGTGSMLISGGALNFGAGNHTVNIDTFEISNQGVVNIAAGSTTTFQNDVKHNGQAFHIDAAGNAIINGGFSGAGPFTGAGTIIFNGLVNPGEGPVAFNVAGNMTLGDSSKSIMDVAGLNRGNEYDAIDVGGTLKLHGELDVQFLNGFKGQLGESFDLYHAHTLVGQFDLINLLALGDGLAWKLDYLTDAIGTTDVVRLSIVNSVPLPGSIWLMQFALFSLVAARRARKAA